jgi:hypothetical protein
MPKSKQNIGNFKHFRFLNNIGNVKSGSNFAPSQVDFNRSISENLKERASYWENSEVLLEQKKQLITSLEEKLLKIKDTPENRRLRGDIRIQIEDETRKLNALRVESDKIGYLSCIAKIVQEESKPQTEQEKIAIEKVEANAKNEEMYISVLGPIRPRLKRKKMNKPLVCGKTTMVKIFIF